MKILMAASEAVPFAKTGGLADVIGSLPKELIGQGVDVRVFVPKYADIPERYQEQMEYVCSFYTLMGWRRQYVGIQKLEHEGVTFYFVDNEYYFKRGGLYGYDDDAERFILFTRAVLEALPYLQFIPDVIHCHDWQSSLIPVLYRANYKHLPDFANIKFMVTIHNMKYQGIYSKELLMDLANLGEEHLHGYALEQNGGGSFLKGGLLYSDIITTVSPTYAEEIQTPYFGESLDSLLRSQSHRLHGIVNGIDYEELDPMKDPSLFVNYRDSQTKKQQNKAKLQEMLGLQVDKDIPMIALVTRLVEQKGLDLISHVSEELFEMDVQWVILGTGEHRYEEMFKQAAERYPQKVSANIRFSEELARKIYASSDLFLMPSLFEPCGIGQLIALRYRSVPVVRETGGLKDTVQPFNEFTNEGTGFTFSNYNAHDMLHTVRRAVHYYHDREAWAALLGNIKKCDYSWSKSAQKYIGLYREMTSLISTAR